MNVAHHPVPAMPAKLWIYRKNVEMPDWVSSAMVGQPMPNGTFLMHSEFGDARVFPGNVIFAYRDHLYSCPHNDIDGTIKELEDRFAPVPAPTKSGAPAASTTPKPQKTALDQPKQARPSTTPKKWPQPLGRPPSIENRHPDELSLDDSYQRSTDNGASRALIKKIATGWDWRMCLPLVVSKRDDGSLWVIDGQHRLAAAKMRGDIPFLPCCVGVYGTVADEAAMFVAMNRARKTMNRLDDFHAAIASGDPQSIEVAKLITDAGFTVSRKTGSQSWRPGEVAFTAAITRVLRKHGPKVCVNALALMKDIWPDEVLSAGSSMFTALTKMEITPPDIADFDQARMHRAIGRRSQREWASWLTDTGGGGEQRAFELTKVLLMAYDEEGAAV